MHIKRSSSIIAALATLAGGIAISASLAQSQPNQTQPNQTQPQSAQSRDVRLGTVDLYLVAERIMQQDQYRSAREQGQANFETQMNRIATEVEQMEAQLQGMQQTDPRAQEMIQRYQTLQTDYQRLQQDRQQELERINSRQLIDAFGQARAASQRIADRRGYTHVLANRKFDRPIETETVGATLQEMLARPLLVGIPEDDLTNQVLTELQLSILPPAPPAAQPGQSGEGIPR